MRISKMIRVFAFGAGILLGAVEATAAIIHTQKAVEPGVWTSDYDGALAYAEENNIPLLVFWANAGCSHCAAIEREMNKEPFLTWMDQHKLVMVFSESDSKVKKWIQQQAKTKIKAYPFMAIYWPKNSKGETVLEGFSGYTGKMSMYGAKSRDSNIQQIMYTVDFLLPDWDPNGVEPQPEPVYYTVNFVVDETRGTVAGGELSQRVESGKGAVAPAVVANDGWEFDGWDKSFEKVTSDLTVTAKFKAAEPGPEPVYYTVNFVVDETKGTVAGGELSQRVESGKGAVAPAVVANDGWEFDGWDKSFEKVTSDLTVTATFVEPEPLCTVNFIVDETKGVAIGELEQKVESGQGAVAPRVVANDGWEFTGWDKSFEKVTSDLTVTATFVERDKIDPAVFFKKARTLNAVAYKGDDLFGRASITLGKYNAKKKYLKASFKITTFAGKSYSKSFNVTPDEFGDFLGLRVVFASPIKTMTFNLVNNDGAYEISGESEDQEYTVEAGTVKIGGTLVSEEMSFSADFEDLEPENDNYDFLDLPSIVSATVRSGKTLNFGASPKLKYNAYKEDGGRWYELAEWDEERYPNFNAVKLSYKPATGVFSGTFKIYATNESSVDDGKKPTLKTYTAKVSGYVVDGVGIGTVSVKVGRMTYYGTCMLDPSN